MTGPYAPAYWALILCNVVIAAGAVVQARAHERRRRCSSSRSIVNIGMWLERFVIVVTSLHRDFLPSSWGMYCPTIWDWRRSSARSGCS